MSSLAALVSEMTAGSVSKESFRRISSSAGFIGVPFDLREPPPPPPPLPLPPPQLPLLPLPTEEEEEEQRGGGLAPVVALVVKEAASTSSKSIFLTLQTSLRTLMRQW